MTKFNRILLLALLALIVCVPSFAQLQPPNMYHTTLLTVRYTNGTLYKGSTSQSIATGTLTMDVDRTNCALPALSDCNIIYWNTGTSLAVTQTPATAFAPGNIVLGTATTNGTTVTALVVFRNPGWSQVTSNYLSDGYYFVSPDHCSMKAATTAFDAGTPFMSNVATGNRVLSATTDTTAGTIQVVCDISPPDGRTTAGKGFLITDVSLLYGVQTTALASIAAATLKSVTYPAAGGAAAGTVAAAGGALTVLPASLQLTTTTTGQCFHENLALATPVAATNLTRITLDQVFTTGGSTDTTLEICGVMVRYFNAPI